jgi:hypothetical protein
MSKNIVPEFVPPIIGLLRTSFYREVVIPEKVGQPIFVLNLTTRTFWMIPVSSTIVITNLIANVPFLYHKR